MSLMLAPATLAFVYFKAAIVGPDFSVAADFSNSSGTA